MTTLLDLKKICEAAVPHFTKWKVIDFGDSGRPMYEVAHTHSIKDDIEDPSNQYSLFEDPAKEICEHVVTFHPTRTAAMIELLMEVKGFVQQTGQDCFGYGSGRDEWLARLAAFEGVE